MRNEITGEWRPSIWQLLLVGLLVVITGLLGLILVWLIISALLRYLALFNVSIWSWRWWHMVGGIVTLLIWLVMVYLSAFCYRREIESGRLWVTFGRFILGQLCVAALVVGGLELVARIRG